MGLTTPIEGATTAPSVETFFVGAGSIDVRNSVKTQATSSISALSKTVNDVAPGSVDLAKLAFFTALESIRPGNFSTDVAWSSAYVIAGDSFLILADILSASLSGENLGSFAYMDINAVLEVNGDEVPIKSFQYQVPTGKLGSILNIRLAEPDVSLVPAGASITFSLKVTVNGDTSTYPLIENGKLQQRDYQIAYRGGNNGGPQDEVSFSSLDVVSDKFGLAPRRPVVMFNPARVRYDTVQTRNDQLVRDVRGNLIVPSVEPVYGLSMRQILQRAYTGIGGFGFISVVTGFGWQDSIATAGTDQKGCGFDGLVTNIPDYTVRRADFTIEGGWHDGAQPVVAMFAPVYFVFGTTLFIMDVEQPIPYGISPHELGLDAHKRLSERLEFKPDSNAVLLTYQYDGNDPGEDPAKVYRDVFHDEVVDESGTTGEQGYSKTTVRRWDREIYMSDNPTETLDTFPLSSTTETVQAVVWYDTDGNPGIVRNRVTHQETVEYQYEGDLKIKHTRETKASVADPGAGFFINLIVVEREVTEISWTEDPNRPGVKLQDRVRTDVSGRCAYDPTNTETVNEGDGDTEFVRMIPVLLAQASGVIDENWIISNMIPISSRRETLHNVKGNQYDVEVIETDFLNNTLKRSYIDPTTGTTSNDPFESKSRTVLMRDTVSEASIGTRIPTAVNAYELPRARAIALGQRVLYRLSNPLMALPIDLAGVDFTIARGSIIKGQKRSGFTGNYFVTGYSISGDNLGKVGHRVSQTLEATEIANALPLGSLYL